MCLFFFYFLLKQRIMPYLLKGNDLEKIVFGRGTIFTMGKMIINEIIDNSPKAYVPFYNVTFFKRGSREGFLEMCTSN